MRISDSVSNSGRKAATFKQAKALPTKQQKGIQNNQLIKGNSSNSNPPTSVNETVETTKINEKRKHPKDEETEDKASKKVCLETKKQGQGETQDLSAAKPAANTQPQISFSELFKNLKDNDDEESGYEAKQQQQQQVSEIKQTDLSKSLNLDGEESGKKTPENLKKKKVISPSQFQSINKSPLDKMIECTQVKVREMLEKNKSAEKCRSAEKSRSVQKNNIMINEFNLGHQGDNQNNLFEPKQDYLDSVLQERKQIIQEEIQEKKRDEATSSVKQKLFYGEGKKTADKLFENSLQNSAQKLKEQKISEAASSSQKSSVKKQSVDNDSQAVSSQIQEEEKSPLSSETIEQPKLPEKGSFSCGDKAKIITSCLRKEGNLFMEIEWLPREDGSIPKKSVLPSSSIRQFNYEILLDFYESKLIFSSATDKKGGSSQAKKKKVES